MRSFVMSFVAAALLSSTAAFAGQPSAEATTPAPETATDTAVVTNPDEMVCKRITGTGTRVGRQRVCKTAGEWDQIMKESQAAARKMGTVRNATKGN